MEKSYAVVVAVPHQTGDVQRGAARGDATAGDKPAPPHASGATATAAAGVQGGAGVAGAGQEGEAPCRVRRVQPLQHGEFFFMIWDIKNPDPGFGINIPDPISES
jgi:hypothetical protein